MFSSSYIALMRSTSLISVLFPMLINFENPTHSSAAQSKIAVHKAPDCEKKAIFPLSGISAANEALRHDCVSINPRQFGPSSRIAWRVIFWQSSFSLIAPSMPLSLKPALITTIESIFFSAHSSTTFPTYWAGTTIIAMSMASWISLRFAYVLRPTISSAFGFTGYIVP